MDSQDYSYSPDQSTLATILEEYDYPESGEHIWISEDTLQNHMSDDSLPLRPSILFNDLPFSPRSHQSNIELPSSPFNHQDPSSLIHSEGYHSHIMPPSEPILESSLNSFRLQPDCPTHESNPSLPTFTREGHTDTRLDLFASLIPMVHSASEIREQFPSLDSSHHSPGSLLDQRQIPAEVRPPSELAADLNVTNFLEGWAREYIRRPRQLARIDLEAVRLLRCFERRMKVTARDIIGGVYDIQGINWPALGTTRDRAQAVRRSWYKQ